LPPCPDRPRGPQSILSNWYLEFQDVKLIYISEVKKVWSYASTPPYMYMVPFLVKYKDSFTFL
jgi:hypothetical protein